MIVATWNVNSLRARKEHLLRWLAEAGPDVVCLQETKLTDELYPHQAIAEAGYPHQAWHGEATYNGVAIASRHPLADVQKGLGDDDDDEQSRFVAATIQGVRVIGVYVPNGGALGSDKFSYKLRWLDRLHATLDRGCSPSDDVLLCGDMNIAPDDLDVWDPFQTEGQVLCHPEERRRLQRLLDWGLVDSFRAANPFASAFTWWDYRKMGFVRNHGMRIDHVLLSRSLSERCTDVAIDRHVRGWDTPSDHVPVRVTLG